MKAKNGIYSIVYYDDFIIQKKVTGNDGRTTRLLVIYRVITAMHFANVKINNDRKQEF